MSEAPANGSAFTQKEMLVRLDSKVDALIQTVGSKNAYYDVELALLKARADKLEKTDDVVVKTVEETQKEQAAIRTRQNIAAGAIAVVVFLAPALWILVNKLVNP